MAEIPRAMGFMPSFARGMKDNLSLCPHFILYLDALVMVNMCHRGGEPNQGGEHQMIEMMI